MMPPQKQPRAGPNRVASRPPPASFDRRAQERMHRDLGALLRDAEPATVEEGNAILERYRGGGAPIPRMKLTTPLEKAQDLMYDAFESRDKKQRVALAKQALETCEDCADAYVLLAEEDTRSVQQACELYRKGVEAGMRALGEEGLASFEGQVWRSLETRPYMRARAGLALCLWQLGQREEAVRHFAEMLELNPDDNQGVRGVLVFWLLELGRYDEVAQILRRFAPATMPELAWAHALWTFYYRGPGRMASKRLRDALVRNMWVLAYLVQMHPIPKHNFSFYELGSPEEAVDCTFWLSALLAQDDRAAQWIADELHKVQDDIAAGGSEALGPPPAFLRAGRVIPAVTRGPRLGPQIEL